MSTTHRLFSWISLNCPNSPNWSTTNVNSSCLFSSSTLHTLCFVRHLIQNLKRFFFCICEKNHSHGDTNDFTGYSCGNEIAVSFVSLSVCMRPPPTGRHPYYNFCVIVVYSFFTPNIVRDCYMSESVATNNVPECASHAHIFCVNLKMNLSNPKWMI